MRSHLFKSLVLTVLALLFSAVAIRAQNVNGAISGEVTDPSGAVVPGAAVTAHNLDTGVNTRTVTDSAGVYHIGFLTAGHYQVTVEAGGFSTATLPPFTLEVLQSATFNVALRMGSASTSVSVSAAAPILNTETISQSSTFTANTIANLPLNGLDFSALTLYMPGSVNTAGTGGMTSIERSTYFVDTPNVNGNRAQANNYTLNGIDMNEDYNNLISYSPAPEALAEVNVLTADSPTEFGNVNGAGVVLMLKTGSDQFHGSAYGYVQDYRLNANSYTNDQSGSPINPFSQAQFGGTLGGPIKRDKLFFFVDYLASRWHKGGSSFASVIPDAMRNGNFSALLAGSNPIQLYDTQNNFAPYSGDTGIPIVNPVAKFLFAHPEYYPDCGAANPALPAGGKCLTPTDGIAQNNYEAPQRSYKANNQGDISIEYDMRASDKVTGFYSMSTAYDGSTAVLPVFFPGIDLFPTWLMGTNWVHTFSPSLVNSARVGFTRTKWSEGLPQDPSGYFGTQGNSKVGISFADQMYNGFTNQGIGGDMSGVGTTAYNGNSLIDNTYDYQDDLTWQRGRHFLSMGMTAMRYQNNYPTGNNDGYLGSLSYSGNFTADPANTTNAGGWGPADFVLDRVQSAGVTLGSINVGQRQWRVAGFAQDNFKVLPNLTLIAGLRYEYDQPWIEQNNKTGNVNLATGQVEYAEAFPWARPRARAFAATAPAIRPTSGNGCRTWALLTNLHRGWCCAAVTGPPASLRATPSISG